MKQLVQKLKNGSMQVLEVPIPQLQNGRLLVRTHYSLISAGTEGSTVATARKGLFGKAKERPQQVKQVFDTLKSQGPTQTYRAVMKKLDAYSPLGYSSAGKVVSVADDVKGFAVGDLVACAGVGYANHAEVVAVPANLCVKLAPDANFKHAAYNTVAAIALQGTRQADLRLGENCAVIGLGLIGQLTCLMLRASGIKVAGIDIDPYAFEMARGHCVDVGFERSTSGIAEKIKTFSGGLGVDAVVITAGSSSLDPINFAGELARKKGRVVVVGAVPTGFDRDPHYYRKELELRMSCSYGPGRYDPQYEEKGIDYPSAYVRWTENRNMQAFQELVYSGKIDIDYLTTHEFTLKDAAAAYDLILKRSEPFLGIVLRYDVGKPLSFEKIVTGKAKAAGRVSLAFVGAGSYAQGNLLPNIPKNDQNVVCKGVMTSSGTTSRRVAERFGFEFCTADENDIFLNDEINTVFIATRHDSHAAYVKKGLQAGKNIFVEKPLCLSIAELEQIEEILLAAGSSAPLLMVGYNRRFAQLARLLKEKMGRGSISMIYRINAGSIPPESWIQDPEIGGGRIIGEVCHFVDFLTFICGALPVRVYAAALPEPNNLQDVVNVSLEFANGSIGTISYFANGSKSLEKEYVEIYQAGVTGILRNFKELGIYSGGKPERKKLINQDKGQKMMVESFIKTVKDGGHVPIPHAEILAVSRTTFKVLESLHSREALLV
ncbi:MAG: bi-domain-containing oxidoreductase [Deltaproteobacteria bacterium]|nr:bi-domain-containing oxidoreductase [Deltaproteobacteria bacterium]